MENGSQTIDSGAAGEAHVEVTPQVGNSDNSAFYWTARGIWIKMAVAQMTGKMLSRANVLCVRTPDIAEPQTSATATASLR